MPKLKLNWVTVLSAATGVALVGVGVYAARQLPRNQITEPVKKAAEIVATK